MKQTWNRDGINSYISGLDKSFGLCPEGQLQPGEAASKPWHSFLNWEFEINPPFPCCAAFFIENLKQNLLFPLVPPFHSPEILTNMVQVGISLHSAGIHLSQQQLLLLTRIKTGKEFRSGIFDSIHWKSSFQDSKHTKFSFQSSPKKPKKILIYPLKSSQPPPPSSKHWSIIPAQTRSNPSLSDSMDPIWDQSWHMGWTPFLPMDSDTNRIPSPLGLWDFAQVQHEAETTAEARTISKRRRENSINISTLTSGYQE